ncbi:MAG: hypothetical protein CML90_03840 [Rhodobiaceae bacterium]|jgi:hypothetical protein|nr:hypothetical protein [Rhodobiaceae bacterium]MED5253791.1 hypothetical protein [Pseudomonadota bacterium]
MLKILYHLLYFLIPFFVYFLWVILSNSKFTNKKTFWVTLISILMFLSSLVFFRLSDTSSKNLDYIPPQVIDGELKDGYFKETDN